MEYQLKLFKIKNLPIIYIFRSFTIIMYKINFKYWMINMRKVNCNFKNIENQ